jgi:hypothetical protein
MSEKSLLEQEDDFIMYAADDRSFGVYGLRKPMRFVQNPRQALTIPALGLSLAQAEQANGVISLLFPLPDRCQLRVGFGF